MSIRDPTSNDARDSNSTSAGKIWRVSAMYWKRKLWQNLKTHEWIIQKPRKNYVQWNACSNLQIELTEVEHIFAIRSQLKVSKVFLKRGCMDIGMNAYNIDNASYIFNYISKVDFGLSKLLRQAVSETEAGNVTLRERFRKISNVFINCQLMSAQEAVYLNLSLPLSKLSWDNWFVIQCEWTSLWNLMLIDNLEWNVVIKVNLMIYNRWFLNSIHIHRSATCLLKPKNE